MAMMRRVGTCLTVALSLCSLQAFAIGTTAQPVSGKRQVLECMSRRMSANRALSYNDATKLCKTEVKATTATVASGTPSKPVSAR